MHIGVDYTAAVKQSGGIGRYTRNLFRTLAELDTDNEYSLFVAGRWGQGDGLGCWPAGFRVHSMPLSDRWMSILWQRLRLPLPIQLFTGPLDLFHSPDFVLPPTGRTPAIVTIHDLSFLRVPRFFVPGFRQYLERAVSRAVQCAWHILADSESTRQDMIELMDVEPERMTVIYPGVESRFQRVQNVDLLEQVRIRYSLPQRFILGLGTLQPRKNFDGLIEAFRSLLAARDGRPEVADLHLVIVGGTGWMYEQLFALVEYHGLKDRVHFTGFVTDTDLPALYSLASVFAFPSWYEGFGLPVLEAMACGTPVVAANNSSLPEVVGKAGLLVDAKNTDALAEAIARLLTKGDLRAHLVRAGRERARRFTWSTAGEHLLAVYRCAVAG